MSLFSIAAAITCLVYSLFISPLEKPNTKKVFPVLSITAVFASCVVFESGRFPEEYASLMSLDMKYVITYLLGIVLLIISFTLPKRVLEQRAEYNVIAYKEVLVNLGVCLSFAFYTMILPAILNM